MRSGQTPQGGLGVIAAKTGSAMVQMLCKLEILVAGCHRVERGTVRSALHNAILKSRLVAKPIK